MKTQIVKTASLKPHPQNANNHPNYQIIELQKSLEQFDQVKNIVVWQGLVIAGNGLWQAAKKSGQIKIEIKDVSSWPEDKAIKYMIADNRLSELSIIDNQIMSDLLVDMDVPENIPGADEDWLKKINNKSEIKKKVEVVNSLNTNAQIKELIDTADKIIYQFSGGRDSTLAILKTLELVRDKNPVACYVDTGTEFPDLLYFIYDFCRKHDLSLQVLHPNRNFFELYGKKQCFPDPVYRDCIQSLINIPVDDIVFAYENPLIIRGGRKKQKTSRSKSNIYQEVVRSKNKTIRLLNPLFAMSDDEYNEEIVNVNVWPGYDKGFLRTACWSCPFQRSPQWEALKEHYPLLWKAMHDMAKTWEFKKIKGDGCIKQFKKYWDMQ